MGCAMGSASWGQYMRLPSATGTKRITVRICCIIQWHENRADSRRICSSKIAASAPSTTAPTASIAASSPSMLPRLL